MSEQAKERLFEAQLRRTGNPRLAKVVKRNIATLCEIREQMQQSKGWHDRLADLITAWAGSMPFLLLHAAWFAAWVAINLGWTRIRPFDEFPFGLLTMVVSLEAIFLSVFVLINQNRAQRVADQRADLDLQINLLAEYEITRVLTLVDAIADHLGLEEGDDPEVEDLKHDVAPEKVLEEMEKQNLSPGPQGNGRNGFPVRPTRMR
jgi:uncharacterized membrane protein